MEQTRSITIDGIAYDLAQFSVGVQQAVGIYNKFQTDLNEAQLEVIKNQSAIQTISAQISEAVKKELAAKAAEAANEPSANAAEAKTE